MIDFRNVVWMIWGTPILGNLHVERLVQQNVVEFPELMNQ